MSQGFLAEDRLGQACRRAGGDGRSVPLECAVDGAAVTVGARRSVDGWLRDAYPVSVDDVELYALEGSLSEGLTPALSELSQSILRANRRCRRVVFAAAAGDEAVVSAAQAAGFRYVLDVDVQGSELSLFVTEPDWVTTSDADLHAVPEA